MFRYVLMPIQVFKSGVRLTLYTTKETFPISRYNVYEIEKYSICMNKHMIAPRKTFIGTVAANMTKILMSAARKTNRNN